MTIYNFLKELDTAGIKVYLDGDRVKVDGINETNKHMIPELKNRKTEIKVYFLGEWDEQEADKQFVQVINGINKKYPVGTMAWVQQNRPDIFKIIIGTENQVNEAYNNHDIRTYQKALDDYKQVNEQAITCFGL